MGTTRMTDEPLLVDLWPDAGMQLGFKSKSQTYAAAKAGFVPTIEVGRRRRKVATAVLKRLKEEGVLRAEPVLAAPAPVVRRRRRRARNEAAV
jgi:hypothetical protein